MSRLRELQSGIEDQLEAMVKRANKIDAYLNRNVYQKYQNYQAKRWMTENAELGKWKPLNKKYSDRKKTKFADFPGSGEKLLIATTTLAGSVIGPYRGGGFISLKSEGTDQHKKLVQGRKLTISTTNPYAEYVDEVRPFTEFSKEFYDDVKKDLSKFLLKGLL